MTRTLSPIRWRANVRLRSAGAVAALGIAVAAWFLYVSLGEKVAGSSTPSVPARLAVVASFLLIGALELLIVWRPCLVLTESQLLVRNIGRAHAIPLVSVLTEE
ncbi:hypothetical protein ABH935_000634 [Catenulispora sp. GAS73]